MRPSPPLAAPAPRVALGARQARIHPFADHRALELCEHAEHLKHGLASRRRGVESLLVQE